MILLQIWNKALSQLSKINIDNEKSPYCCGDFVVYDKHSDIALRYR